MTIAEFLEMGGYAVFVWPAYLITAIVLAGSLLLSRARHRRLRNIVAIHAQNDSSKPE